MPLFRRILGLFTARGKSLARYRAGMEKAKAKDYQGAIADYTAVIDAANTPADVQAMATYNRALAYSALHEEALAEEDLSTILNRPDLPEDIKVAAQQRRERLLRRKRREGVRDETM
ncbi:MAG: hypothetical protein D6753_10645 [Planctomycetota bacterium]|nr:MAG: hypothetical protein D6753_10645 [Planctomycetota bacterium]